MIVYKLTDKNLRAHGGFQWKIGERVSASGTGPLCTDGWLHAYEHPLLAVLHNPIHANYSPCRLFRARGTGKILRDGMLTLGCKHMVLVKEISVPEITITQRVTYGILCARAVVPETNTVWHLWADNWLSGKDRSARTADTVAIEGWAAAEKETRETNTVVMAELAAAEMAAQAAAGAPEWAAAAVEWATRATKTAPLDLLKIAEEAMKIK